MERYFIARRTETQPHLEIWDDEEVPIWPEYWEVCDKLRQGTAGYVVVICETEEDARRELAFLESQS